MLNKPLNTSGFSLIELITTITIVSILTAIAVPSFTTIISNNRLTTYSNEFVTALYYARSEAIKRGVNVTVARKGSTPREWKYGWDVFVDIDGQPSDNLLYKFGDDETQPKCDTDSSGMPKEDCLLRTFANPDDSNKQFLPPEFTLESNDSFSDTISFNAMGQSKSNRSNLGTGTFVMCDNSRANANKDELKSAKVFIITGTGRVRMVIPDKTTGIPTQADGTPFECNPE
jgi:type IV fimbrial biogenesis protein FimT